MLVGIPELEILTVHPTDRQHKQAQTIERIGFFLKFMWLIP